MHSPEDMPETPAPSSNSSDKTLEVVSKSVAIVAILVYAFGFLITSIYHASYGFLEVDPLRPRILFAGTWFVIFMAFPITLGWRFLQRDHWESNEPWWLKVRGFLFDYYAGGVSVLGLFLFDKIFDFDPYATVAANSTGPHHWWQLSGWKLAVAIVVGLIGFLVLLMFVSVQLRKYVPERWRKALGAVFWVALVLWTVYSSYEDVYEKGHFHSSALYLWFLAVGILAVAIARAARGTITPSNVPILGYFILWAVTSFSTVYYPHIKSSLGGGAPIQATICFSKDSPVMPLQNARVSIIDESSLGFYVLASGEKKATFIPRAFVGVIYFSNNQSGKLAFEGTQDKRR